MVVQELRARHVEATTIVRYSPVFSLAPAASMSEIAGFSCDSTGRVCYQNTGSSFVYISHVSNKLIKL